MKIIDTKSPFERSIVGKQCDRCQHRVQMLDHLHSTATNVISQGAEVSGFVAIDIDCGASLSRADLCPSCADAVITAGLQAFLPHFREIAVSDPRRGYRRVYRYTAIEADTGQPFEVSSLYDDGA